MKTIVKFLCLILLLAGDVSAQTMSYSSIAQVTGTNLGSNIVVTRMRGIFGYIRANNAGNPAKTLTITVQNIDPDYVTLSEGTITSKGTNTLTFTLSLNAGATHTVYINPWYMTSDIYFIAWSDNQDGDVNFKNKLIPKAALINAIFAVTAGDVTKATPPTIGGAGTAGTYPAPNDYMRDFHFVNYLSLLQNYTTPIMEVPGNHDLSRGGWTASPRSDARFDSGQAVWRRYLGPTYYSFNAGTYHFSMLNFHYDMPNWCQAWGGNQDMGYFKINAADTEGNALKTWLTSDLTAASTSTARITVSHHGLNMFVPDYHTRDTVQNLFVAKNVNYMINGHQHSYSTGTIAGINYLITGDAQKTNPGFSLVHANGSTVTQQHMYADNLNLTVTHSGANNGTLTTNTATVVCSGYSLPFIRVKYKMSNAHAAYKAKDVATGVAINAYSHQFSDYTVVYVETSINDGATKNILVEPITTLMGAKAAVANEDEGNKLMIAPNPAINNITVTLPGKGHQEFRITLFDLSGRAIRTVKTSDRSVVIHRENLKSGVYLVKIAGANGYDETKKIIFE